MKKNNISICLLLSLLSYSTYSSQTFIIDEGFEYGKHYQVKDTNKILEIYTEFSKCPTFSPINEYYVNLFNLNNNDIYIKKNIMAQKKSPSYFSYGEQTSLSYYLSNREKNKNTNTEYCFENNNIYLPSDSFSILDGINLSHSKGFFLPHNLDLENNKTVKSDIFPFSYQFNLNNFEKDLNIYNSSFDDLYIRELFGYKNYTFKENSIGSLEILDRINKNNFALGGKILSSDIELENNYVEQTKINSIQYGDVYISSNMFDLFKIENMTKTNKYSDFNINHSHFGKFEDNNSTHRNFHFKDSKIEDFFNEDIKYNILDITNSYIYNIKSKNIYTNKFYINDSTINDIEYEGKINYLEIDNLSGSDIYFYIKDVENFDLISSNFEDLYLNTEAIGSLNIETSKANDLRFTGYSVNHYRMLESSFDTIYNRFNKIEYFEIYDSKVSKLYIEKSDIKNLSIYNSNISEFILDNVIFEIGDYYIRNIDHFHVYSSVFENDYLNFFDVDNIKMENIKVDNKNNTLILDIDSGNVNEINLIINNDDKIKNTNIAIESEEDVNSLSINFSEGNKNNTDLNVFLPYQMNPYQYIKNQRNEDKINNKGSYQNILYVFSNNYKPILEKFGENSIFCNNYGINTFLYLKELSRDDYMDLEFSELQNIKDDYEFVPKKKICK